ncbi:MAG: hypothetical protein HRU41_36685 [Saprospiraceae bacterium]|nr:hypothetical protein [Saprospiraceae bacterium]
MSKKTRKRVQLIFSSLFAQFAVPVSNIAVSILVVRWFSAELWGEYVEHLLLVSLVLTVVHWGSKEYLSKQFSKAPKNISLDLQRSIVSKVLLLLALSLLLSLIPLRGLEKGLILAWIWARASWQFFESLNTYRRLFVQVAVVEVVLVLGMIACLFQFEMNIRLLLGLFIGIDLIKFVLYGALNHSYLRPWRGAEGWRNFFRDSFPFFLLTLSSLAASRADVYLLSLWEETKSLAQYQIITNFIQYAHLLATAIMLPFLKNIFRLQFDSIQQLERQFISLGLILGVILTGGIYGITTFLYQFEMSYIVITLIYLNIVVFYFYFLRIPAGFSFNKMWSVIFVMSLMGGINLLLGILIIPTLGMIGGLLSSLSAGILGLLGFRSKKLFHFS